MLVLLLQDWLVCAIRGGNLSLAYTHMVAVLFCLLVSNTSLYVIVLIGCNSMLGFFVYFSLEKASYGKVPLIARCAVKGNMRVGPKKYLLCNCYVRSKHQG